MYCSYWENPSIPSASATVNMDNYGTADIIITMESEFGSGGSLYYAKIRLQNNYSILAENYTRRCWCVFGNGKDTTYHIITEIIPLRNSIGDEILGTDISFYRNEI